jgi:hypothetical protein
MKKVKRLVDLPKDEVDELMSEAPVGVTNKITAEPAIQYKQFNSTVRLHHIRSIHEMAETYGIEIREIGEIVFDHFFSLGGGEIEDIVVRFKWKKRYVLAAKAAELKDELKKINEELRALGVPALDL